jgi:thioredoxin-like negative regulator of GroEL
MSLPDITQAMNSKDYRAATKLIQQLGSGERQNPLIQLYMAQIYEASHKLAQAQALYRQLLQDPSNPKVMNQARQGLKRLENWEATQRQTAIAQAKADPGGTNLGLLILEGLDPAGSPTEKQTQRQLAAQKFAKIMQLDAYSARLQLPSTGWRLYRTGAVGEILSAATRGSGSSQFRRRCRGY